MWATLDVARAGPTSARRRRERRFRSFFRHEQVAIKMAVVTAQHHSAQRCCSIASQTVVEYVDPAPVVPAPVTGYLANATAVTFPAPAPVIGYVAPAPSVTFATPASVFEYVAPAPVLGFAPAPAGSFVAPSQQLRPYTAAAVTTGVNLDADVVGSASQVVGSLPHGEVFTGPGFFHVHHEHIASVPVVTEFFPLSDDDGDAVKGSPPPCLGEPRRPQEQVQRHTMEQLADVAPMVPSLAVPEPQMVDQLVAMVKHVDSVVPEQIIAVPKISWPSRFPRTVLREPQKAEQLVEVPVPAPSFSDWFRWEETYRRTGHTWHGGFDWCLTASPGRYTNTGPGPRRRPWYRAASVPAHRQSGGDPWLRLSRQLDTVQSVQLWGVRGELQRQVPAVPRRL